MSGPGSGFFSSAGAQLERHVDMKRGDQERASYNRRMRRDRVDAEIVMNY